MSVIQHDFEVIIGGNDVTSRFRPRLISLTVDRAAGKAADSANLVLSNKDGTLAVPDDRAEVEIRIDGLWVFSGFVTEVECTLDKSSGRELNVVASSVDQGSKAKEQMLRHKDNAAFSDVAAEFGEKAGIDVQVLGSIAQLQRDYWIQQNESFVSWGQRTAKEIGATFKVMGRRAFFAARNEGLSASGRPLTPINAAWGDNLLSASIRPIVSRPRFRNVRVQYFDQARGEYVDEEFETGIDDVDAALRQLTTAASREHAQQKAQSLGKESDREKGQGDVVIYGDARAEPEAKCTVSGVAARADGSYRIDSLKHSISKKGFTTSLTLRQPQDGAGRDPRLPETGPVPTPRPVEGGNPQTSGPI